MGNFIKKYVGTVLLLMISGCYYQEVKHSEDIMEEYQEKTDKIIAENTQYSINEALNSKAAYLLMTEDECYSKINIKDDSLEKVAVFDSHNVFIESTISRIYIDYLGKPKMNLKSNDFFLRGYLDKDTLKKTIQIYGDFYHNEGPILNPYQANYGVPLTSSDVDVLDMRHSREQFVFVISDDEILRLNGIKYSDEPLWHFKIKTKTGEDVTGSLNVNEITAFLKKMNEYQPVKTQ